MSQSERPKVKLEQIVKSKKGKKPKRLDLKEFSGSVAYIDIEAFEKGIIKKYADQESSNLCDETDILVVWDGARFGLVGTNQKGAVGSTLMRITPVGVKHDYLKYFLNYMYPVIQQNPKGMATPHVNAELFWNMEVPLPRENIQSQIVTILNSTLSSVNHITLDLNKIPALLKKIRLSVLGASCSGKLTEDWRKQNNLPDWEERELGQLSKLITKGASPKWQGVEYVDNPGVLFVTSENVYGMELRLSTKKYVEEKINTIQKRSVLQRGDLLTNIVGASIGRTALYDLDETANVNQAVAIIRLKDDFSPDFYLLYLNSPEYIAFLQQEKVDVARANISLKMLKEMMVPVPSLSEQAEIVKRTNQLLNLADSLESKYKLAMSKIEKLEQSILAKAFRGEL